MRWDTCFKRHQPYQPYHITMLRTSTSTTDPQMRWFAGAQHSHMLVHLGGHAVEGDYRRERAQRFAEMQGFAQVSVGLESLTLAQDHTERTVQLQQLSADVIRSKIDTMYLAVSQFDAKPLLEAVRVLCEELHGHLVALDSCEPPLRVCLLEDLICLPRCYVYENKHTNFFKRFLALAQPFPRVTTLLSSTNEVTNSWGEGDCYVVRVPELLADPQRYWARVVSDVPFQEMHNQGNPVPRLVSIQSLEHPTLGRPLYRHPNDEEPPNQEMQPVVQELRQLVETHTGLDGLNHVLIQHYRDGRDNIAAHSDKTLDLDAAGPIVNLSLGCARDLFLQSKVDRTRFERVPLRHGELLVLGLATNRMWFHEVPKDVLLQPHPLFSTSRISFTWRRIASFITAGGVVVGRGSPYKTLADLNGPPPPTRTRGDLIAAFSKENKQADEFDWHECYGGGFLLR